ncbi:restriction endonuclease [Acinetobacter variabilis]|uniref:restriction endonuclease n=1 Tax=Acinetobacter variabilis TaxID=70346 RepID=UPI0035D43FB1
MNSIQLFQDAFAVDFPVEVADQILGRIQQLYGAEFDKKFGSIDPVQLQQTTCTVLNGLKPKDIKRGLDRMLTEKWCPSLPEFRSWCIAADWWTADQAWAKAMNFEADPSKPITALAKCALDEVRHILDVEGQKAAHRAFKDIYEDYLQKAKDQGRAQELWKKPEVKTIGHNYAPRSGVPCPPELAAMVKRVGKSAGGGV